MEKPTFQVVRSKDFSLEEDCAVGHGERILIVEDDIAVRTLCVKALGKAGFEILEASDGSEALAIIHNRSHEIDLVLADLAMPGITGLNILHEVKRQHPQISVILMSGNFDLATEDRDDLLRLGAHELTKPFRLAVLVRTVRQALAKTDPG